MLSRRISVFACLALAVSLLATPAMALRTQSFSGASVSGIVASGKPVVIHVYAGWCLQCRAQASILAAQKGFGGVTVYRVDHNSPAAKALGVPRSTLIAYKGGKEVKRMSWGTSTESVVGVLQALK